ncbi:MAG: hypothetical protein JW888_10110 [Pirellulales bacterium]|nr:hypothetical protein [Pirellulales bacterium]
MVLLLLSCAGRLAAAQDEVHYLHQGVMPPGAIGNTQLQRGGPLPGYFQPVEIKAPRGVAVSLAVGNTFDQPASAPLRVGMLIGQVYRVRVTQIPLAEGREIFPTIEIIDRLYTPQGQAKRFAIPIELTEEDLRLAAQGKFVTRVIYVENPFRALPATESPSGHNWFDVGPGRDPLAAADALGRPVAILRLGGRLPSADGAPDADFFFGSPPVVQLPERTKRPVPPARSKSKPTSASKPRESS